MAIPREELTRWIFGAEEARRYTQDSPILPDVWLAYGEAPDDSIDLLLTPHAKSTAAALASALAHNLGGPELGGKHLEGARLAYSESYVVASLSFAQLIRCVLPLSRWWYTHLWPPGAEDLDDPKDPKSQGERELHGDLGLWAQRHVQELQSELLPRDERHRRTGPGAELAWLIGLIGRIASEQSDGRQREPVPPDADSMRQLAFNEGAALLAGMRYDPRRARQPLLWAVSRNRQGHTALWRSTRSIKADAVGRLFDSSCAGLRWGIIDSGVDATHPAFRRRDEHGKLVADPFGGAPPKLGTRVVASYDFTRLRTILAREWPAPAELPPGADHDDLDQIEARLRSGRAVDWDSLKPLLRVAYDDSYVPPAHEHGTHVAGILGGHWRTTDPDMPADHDLIGVCPDIEIYDLRVFDDKGNGDEFAISAALQFVRYLNNNSDLQVIHGVNLSLSLAHDVANYAVGRTPVCDECERLVGAGICVVTVAGNEGRARYEGEKGVSDGFRTVSITDPGNAQKVITVGATHRYEPHTYGVSYFSSRGPTGDGRPKPDLVAPGEKINSPVPSGGYKAKDGTSQAAPHVSGAAALLMARYDELRGKPEQIKQILCESASDLGRDKCFQGAGMLDVLRAMQAV
jgi:serine protease AprX